MKCAGKRERNIRDVSGASKAVHSMNEDGETERLGKRHTDS